MTAPFWVYPSGSEDVGWWASNRPRVNQQIQLGMVGSIARVAGSIQPVAVVDDLSALSDVFNVYWYGGSVGTPIVGVTPVLEVNVPRESDVDVFVWSVVYANQTGGGAAVVRVNNRTPSLTTGLALITGRATQLSDGFRSGSPARHRVFIGDVGRPGFNWGVGVNDAGGMWAFNWDPTTNHGMFHFPRQGWRIPRGMNLVVADEQNGPTAPMFLGCVVLESKAPTGPI